jgi:hypothetical protein
VAGVLAFAASSMVLQGSAGLSSNRDARLLAAHNRERSAAGIAPLAWNPELAAGAAQWAAQLARTNAFDHSSAEDAAGEPLGENLFMGTRGAYPPEEMVGMWVAEKSHFKPGVFPDNSRTGAMEDVGHYTQLMWRDTRQVGCAVAPSRNDEFLVCRYAQAGNVEGERPF